MALNITFLMPYLQIAGGNKTVGCLADGLLARGHRVRLVHPTALRWPPFYRPRTFVRHLLTHGPELLRPSGAVYVGNTGAQMIGVAKPAPEPADVPDGDVVIATWWETIELLELLPPSKGAKVHYVQADEPFFAGPGLKQRAQAAYASSAYPICVASHLRVLMTERYGHAASSVVPNGLEPRFDAPERARNARPTVGFLFSNFPLKGAHVATEAVRLAEQRVGPIDVVAFGAERPARGTRLPRSFEFHFKPAQSEIPKLHARADVWLVCSTSEGFALPGLEAAGCRCPVIATRCGGPAEYVRDGETGFLVDVGDAPAMARAIERVLTMPAAEWKAMSDASYRVARQFSWPRSVELFEQALLTAIEQSRAGNARELSPRR